MSATEAAAALGVDSPRCAVAGVSIDSRSVQVGDLFIALAGERFDGHDYVVQALAAGACGALVEESTW
ncbi:MAG TPA: Mur ligase domain-containing protein, partial [Thermoleophilia bacterium]